MIRNFLTLCMIAMLATALGGCNIPANETGTTLSLLEPVDGQQFEVGELIRVRSMIASAEGVSSAELLVNGQPVRSDHPVQPLRSGSILQPWQTAVPGLYTIQTRIVTTSGTSLNSAAINIIVGEVAEDSTVIPSISPAETLTSTPTPTVAFTATPTPTITSSPPPAVPMATANLDANCRTGPGPIYNISSYLLTGQSARITGRNVENTWWVIERVDGNGICWIWGEVVTVNGDTSAVLVVAAPPTPTPTVTEIPPPQPPIAPIPLSPNGSFACKSTVVLKWEPVTHPNGIDHYEWQVTGPVETKSGTTTNTQAEFIVSCGTSYSWQVRAVDGMGNPGPYSGPMSFSIQ